MSQEQLKPYFNQDFQCDKCQRKFHNETAYSLDSSLKETYCVNCIELTEEDFCSFREVDDKTKQYLSCDKTLFDKKKSLCRSHNRQVWKRFNEFTKDKSVSSTAAWLETWDQSRDWRYFWNLANEKEKFAKNNPNTKARTNKNDWDKIKKKSLGEVPQEPSQNLQAPELAPSDKRITGRIKQLNLKVKEQTYWKLKEFALKEKCLMTEILEKALICYDKHHKN